MSTDIVVEQLPPFKKIYKKLHQQDKKIVNEAIKVIVNNPYAGEAKIGDLSGVYVYKFKIHNQEKLLGYEWDVKRRLLLLLGSHENFYRELKRVK